MTAITDRFAPLYPESTADLLVVDRLPAPAHPSPPPFAPHRGGTFFQCYRKEEVLGALPVEHSDDRLMLMDKAFPHSRYDLMLMVANDDVRNSPLDIDPRTLQRITSLAASFVDHVSDTRAAEEFGLDWAAISIGYNHNRYTRDRDNAQWFDKRMHWHLICWPDEDVRKKKPKRLADVSSVREKRWLVDPIGFLGPDLLYAAVRKDSQFSWVGKPDLERDRALRLPVGLKIALPNGWDFLRSGDCADWITRLHLRAEEAFRTVRSALTGSEDAPGLWMRPRILPAKETERRLRNIGWITPELRERLLVLRGLLRDVSAEEMLNFRADPSAANHRLSIADLDYHMGFCTPSQNQPGDRLRSANDVYMFMQFKLFSSPGPVPAVGGANAVTLERQHGPVMTTEQLDRRSAFQSAYVRRIGAEPGAPG
ncbi:hypothetical protein ACFXKG_13780 [Streptomyces sp. NPDC059255]|uniref:hypothetical protein n=1 Tax=Streptomyces sp. NPDC059255 TaxID=3346793 RepID=UPI0036CFFDC4